MFGYYRINQYTGSNWIGNGMLVGAKQKMNAFFFAILFYSKLNDVEITTYILIELQKFI